MGEQEDLSELPEDQSSRFLGKEFVLNYTAQRYQLTRPNSVGPVMELIRECQPKTLLEWEKFYWEKAFTKNKAHVKMTAGILMELGERLYEKIQEVVIPAWTKAFEEITKEDCIEYIKDLTFRRTFSGFMREKSVVFDHLSNIFPEIKFEESDSDLDHAGDVDFIGKVANKGISIGIQIKPVTGSFAFSGYSPSERMRANFANFKEKYGGSVFVVFSEKKEIKNKSVIEAIRKEIS